MKKEHIDFFVGKEISKVFIQEDELHIQFDKKTLVISDDGQSCCEHRYMTTDDNLTEFFGAIFKGIEEKPTYSISDDEFEDHDLMFIEIKTSKGDFILKSHNDHNGYYGGFDIITTIINEDDIV